MAKNPSKRAPGADSRADADRIAKRISRRDALWAGAFVAGGATALASSPAAAAPKVHAWDRTYSGGRDRPHDEPGKDYRPVFTPGGATLPFEVVDGVKIYHLVAQEVDREFAPGLKAKCWGYNGRVHGPTIEAVEGDRVRVYVTNELSAPTTVHWHGVYLPSGMDGVGGVSQRSIAPGGMFTLVKVRDEVRGFDDPGWYENPPGTQADLAKPEDLKRDGIRI